jgi:tetratricopeptide (TPR) repeat protein
VINDLDRIAKEGGKKHQVTAEALACAEAAIERLVRADRILAETLILDAENTPVENTKNQDKVDKELAKSAEELAKGDADRDAGKFDKAIQHYKKAWEHACHAIKHATKT